MLWDFGDGNTDTTKEPTHTYQANGNYAVTLTASNACGNSRTYTKDVVVSDTISQFYPSFFDVFDDTICPGDAFRIFDWSWNNNGEIALWDFGDGIQEFTANPQHAYANTGIYPVMKTTTSACGYSASYIDTVVVANTVNPLIPYLSDYLVACPGDSIKFEPYTYVPPPLFHQNHAFGVALLIIRTCAL